MDIQSIHNVLIISHSAAAIISFVAGCLLIFSPAYLTNQRLFNLYSWSLMAMVVFLAAAVSIYWTEYSGAERIVFPGLLGLGIFMFLNARVANSLLKAGKGNWKAGYIESIGFTIISLFEGFVIVSGLNSGFPGWLIAILAILGLVAGRWIIGFARRRVV